MKDFEKELADLLNRHSMENASNTPDFLLAEFLHSTLTNYSNVVKNRDNWLQVDTNRSEKCEHANHLEMNPREVLIDVDDFAEAMARNIAESDTPATELLDFQTIQKTLDGSFVSVELSQKGIDIMTAYATSILEDYIYDRIHNGCKEHGLNRDFDPELKRTLFNMLGAYPMSSNPTQTRAKIEAYKALGWK